MVCPYCGSESRVYNSRVREHGFLVWRRRHCATCGASWTTHEKIVDETVYRVARGKSISPFSESILYASVYECLKHRPGAPYESKQLTETITTKLQSYKQAIIEISQIRKAAYETLSAFDPLSGELFSALHPDTTSSAK